LALEEKEGIPESIGAAREEKEEAEEASALEDRLRTVSAPNADL
jgi:hypothetical protein